MKNTIKKTILLVLLIFSGFNASAQLSDAVHLDNYSLNKEEGVVRVSIKTTESFIVAANRYVLHIGGKHFFRNIHPDGRLDEVIFLIPQEDYETLESNGRIVLVYGYYYENTLLDQEGNDSNEFVGLHWDLGSFTAQELEDK